MAATNTSSQQQENLRPGFFHLNLGMLKDEQCADFDARLESLRNQLNTSDPATRSALRNLIGVALYARRDYDEAEDCFVRVLNEDATNLNAQCHMERLAEALGQWNDVNDDEAEYYRHRRHEATGDEDVDEDVDDDDDDDDGDNDDEGDDAAATGKMLLEQAYACTFDSFTNGTHEKYLHAIMLYNRGLQMMNHELQESWSLSDQLEWRTCLGLAYVRLMNVHNTSLPPAWHSWYTSAVEIIYAVCEDSAGLDSEADSWTLLGRFLSKWPNTMNSQNIKSMKLLGYFYHPELCFKKALELKPCDRKSSCNYAVHLLCNKNPQQALEVIGEVFRTQQPGIDWFEHMIRAEARLHCYENEPTPANKEAYLRPAMEQDIQHKKNFSKHHTQIIAKIMQYLGE